MTEPPHVVETECENKKYKEWRRDSKRTDNCSPFFAFFLNSFHSISLFYLLYILKIGNNKEFQIKTLNIIKLDLFYLDYLDYLDKLK